MKKSIDRRLFLRGTGSVLIGLPILEESLVGHAFAQSAATPTRCLTMSFGLGIEKDLQKEQWDGPLEPFQNLSHKMAFFSNLNNNALSGRGTPHFDVGATLFTGLLQKGHIEASGPSLEQLMRLHLHPNGVPSATGIPSMSAGIWSRTGAVPQYMRHWNSNGSPGNRPERRPSVVFDRLFGSLNLGNNSANTNTELDIERRIRRSVLDSVVEQANALTGANSYLGQDSKDKINTHLETIRSVERELIEGDLANEEIAAGEAPTGLPQSTDFQDPPGVSFYDANNGPTTGPKVTHEAASRAFRLSGKLFALGFYTDALRFGSLIFVGAGGHIRFSGNYNAENIGQSLNFSNEFESSSAHDAIFHNYNKSAVRVYQHYSVSQMAYVLEEMDKLVEANGKSVLDNTLTVIGTEYGKNHEGNGNIFHAVAGGNDLFNPGQYDSAYGFNDLYKTLVDAYRIPHSISGNTIGGLIA